MLPTGNIAAIVLSSQSFQLGMAGHEPLNPLTQNPAGLKLSGFWAEYTHTHNCKQGFNLAAEPPECEK